MSLPTVAAARIYKNQQKHQNENLDDLADFDGNSEKLSWEEFPNVGLSMVSSFCIMMIIIQYLVLKQLMT